jgi:hypothetical protein
MSIEHLAASDLSSSTRRNAKSHLSSCNRRLQSVDAETDHTSETHLSHQQPPTSKRNSSIFPEESPYGLETLLNLLEIALNYSEKLSDLQDKPPNFPEELTHYLEKPTHCLKKPVHCSEILVHCSEIPTNFLEIPTHCSEIPTNFLEIPTHCSEELTNSLHEKSKKHRKQKPSTQQCPDLTEHWGFSSECDLDFGGIRRAVINNPGALSHLLPTAHYFSHGVHE